MKTNLFYRLLMGIFLFGIVSSCDSQTTEPKTQQTQYIKDLLGRWEVKEAKVYSKDPGKDARILGTFRTGLAYIFYDNNSYDGCIQSGSDWDNAGQSGTLNTWKCSSDKSGSWTLMVGKSTNTTGYLDEDSFITLKSPTLKEPQEYQIGLASAQVLALVSKTKKDDFGTETWMFMTLEKK